jgi:F0F1-type ATP synthase membrane subunit c/vacuolar-type H+-ATPase subunit K
VEITSVYQISDNQAVDGDILSVTPSQGLVRATIPYDSNLFGVLQTQPLAVYRRFDNQGQPVARTGIAEVYVTTLNGPIVAGDYITTSDIPGKGQKAARSGYVLGRALSNLVEGSGPQIDYQNPQNKALSKKVSSGKITVALRIEYAELTTSRNASRLFEQLNAAMFTNVQSPEKFSQIVRNIAAALIILASLLIGFLTSSRSLPKAIEAIGRNPLAKNSIYISIGINIALTVAIVILGIVAGVIVLRI